MATPPREKLWVDQEALTRAWEGIIIAPGGWVKGRVGVMELMRYSTLPQFLTNLSLRHNTPVLSTRQLLPSSRSPSGICLQIFLGD
ncbi:hypothetical protein VTN00DRAFT_4587 [Thermoascus crustaceus]|uniref:uncharacterized protein n=1 Tax=Thermoascus crustaceus TaxID=5088 RepID=UPI00374316F8